MRASLRALVVASLVLVAPTAARAQSSSLLSEAGPAAWRTPHAVYGAALRVAPGSDDASAAREVLARHGSALGLSPGALTLVRRTEAHGYVVVELAPVVQGLAVRGAPVVVRRRPDGAVDLVDVTPLPELRSPWPGAVSLERAGAVAVQAAPFARASVLSAELVPLVHEQSVVAAVEVELAGPGRADRARAYVDASTLGSLYVVPLGLDALGRVFPHNPTSDAMVTMDLPLVDLPASATTLDGSHLRVESCDQTSAMCAGSLARATADVDGNFLYDPDLRAYDDAFAEVSAYYHGSLAVAYFDTAHSFTWTCGSATRMDVAVNYSDAPHVPYENAMFIPGSRSTCGQLVFGQGALHDYAYDGDVVYHEYGHAVTDAISMLGFFATGPSDNYQPLGINEGTSDYWAATIQGDPLVGESIGSVEGFMGSLRGLEDMVVCPNDLIGEGHMDGRIWSGFGWAMRTILGPERSDPIWYTTMATLSGGVTLAQGTNTVLTTVASEVAAGHVTTDEQTMIMDAATTRGLPDCTMFVPIDDGESRSGYSGNAFVTGGLSHGLAPLQYTLTIPPDVVDVEIDVGHATLNAQANVHFMTGGPVRATGSRITSQLSVPTGRIGTARFTLAQGLTPCTTLYVGVESIDLRTNGETLFSIVARVNTTHMTRNCPPPRPDAGPPHDAGTDAALVADAGPDGSTDAPPAGGGCGCSVPGSDPRRMPWVAAILALPLLAARRRRAP